MHLPQYLVLTTTGDGIRGRRDPCSQGRAIPMYLQPLLLIRQSLGQKGAQLCPPGKLCFGEVCPLSSVLPQLRED